MILRSALSRSTPRSLVEILANCVYGCGMTDMSTLATTYSRSLGPELLGLWAMQQLDFDGLLKKCSITGTDAAIAKAVILAKLIAPCSDLATWHWLRQQSSTPELLGIDPMDIGRNAIYEATDLLYDHKDQIESFLRNKERQLFKQDMTLYLYDLTNTFLEGTCRNNPLGKRGKSKEKRSDCPLVCLALLVDSNGFPIFSDIYSGNQSEPETLEAVLDRLAVQHSGILPLYLPTIVMDRGIATKENLALLKEGGYPYLVVERRPVAKEYVQDFQNTRENFMMLEDSQGEPVYLQRTSPDLEDACRVLVLSETRAHTEQAMDSLKEERFLDGLQRLQKSILGGHIKQLDKVNIRIGRLLERYPTIERYYDVTPEVKSEQAAIAVGLTWAKKPIREERSILTGCYVIDTSHKDMAAEEIWKAYNQLTTVEASFRALKSALGLRPIFHQKEDRTKAHLFLAVIAYHLLNTIDHQLRQANYNHRWTTVRDAVSNHQRTTVIVTGEDQKIYHTRVSGTSESPAHEIYNLLGVKDPLRANRNVYGARL
jgi:transposase